jgi:hypothetical protein
MNLLWHVFTGDKDPSPLQGGKMPVGARIVASLDSALNIIGAEYPGEDLKFMAEGESVRESEFRALANTAGEPKELVILGRDDVERIKADLPA